MNKQQISIRSLQVAFSLCALLTAPSIVNADEPGAVPARAPQASSTAPLPQTVLEGGVKGTAVRTEEGLTQIMEAANQAQTSTQAIMQEAMRKDTVVMRGPNVLPNGVVIPALGGTGGVMQMGELPIRRDRLDRYVENTSQTLKSLQSFMDGLIIPPEKSEAVANDWNYMKANMDDAQEHFKKLEELSAAKKLVNRNIAKEALRIHDDMERLEKYRSSMVLLVR